MQTFISNGLLFRPFEERDVAIFAEAVRETASSERGQWMSWCHANYTEQEALDWISKCKEGLAQESVFEFGVFSADGNEFLGGAGLNQINKQHAFCNLGYWVRHSKQRQGIATRCVQVLSSFGFETLKLTRIEIVIAVGNIASDGVALKSGALFERVARNRLVLRGTPVAASVFSLIPPAA